MLSAASPRPSPLAVLAVSLGCSLLSMPSLVAALVEKSIVVDHTATFQEFHGCGASWTESSAWLMYGNRDNPSTDPPTLTDATRDAVFDDLFGDDATGSGGIGLRIVRQPMGTSDFRWSDYTYEDTEGSFSVGRDEGYIIPTMQRTLEYNDVKVMSLPWSPPAWMKRQPRNLNGGSLDRGGAVYDDLGAYFAKYVMAYEDDHGIPIWAVSVQNEPQHATGQYPTMQMSPAEHADAATAIRAALDANGKDHVKLVAYEHNWDTPDYPAEVLSYPAAKAAIDAIAFHCYAGDPSAQSDFKNDHLDGETQEIFFTECTEYGEVGDSFNGDFRWAVENLVVGAVRNWASTVLEWNLVLYQGGPKISGGCDDCRGLIDIVTSTSYEKRPAFYALGHLSKFAKVGATRIGSTEPDSETKTVALLNPDGTALAVVLNNGGVTVEFKVAWFGVDCAVTVPAWSAITLVSTDASDRTIDAQVWATYDGDETTRLTRVSDATCIDTSGGVVTSSPAAKPSAKPSASPAESSSPPTAEHTTTMEPSVAPTAEPSSAPIGSTVSCGDYDSRVPCNSIDGCKWKQNRCQVG